MTAIKNMRALKRGWRGRIREEGPFRASDGWALGVAKGLAEHFGYSVGLTRLALVLSALVLFFWPTLVFYLAAACIMSPSPPERGDRRRRAAKPDPEGLVRRAEELERRLRLLEDAVTSRDFAWRRRF